MQRTKVVKIGEKTYTVQEKKVKELKEIFAGFTTEADKVIGADKAQDLTGVVNSFLGDKLTAIFPGISAEDIDNSYPSDIEELVGAFIDVNFTGLKKVGIPLFNLFQLGKATQQQKAASAL